MARVQMRFFGELNEFVVPYRGKRMSGLLDKLFEARASGNDPERTSHE
jgi:hypothetical protein